MKNNRDKSQLPIDRNQDDGEARYMKDEIEYIKAWDEFYIEW